MKNELVDEETFAGRAGNFIEKTYAECYTLYQQRLRQGNALDFDDLIMTTVNLLQAFPDVAEHYRRRFRHVVDEYQDTNHAQYVLIRELVGTDDPAELCVVGDADQSIYAFRGATIRNILEFERDFPNARIVLLEQNYRSTQTILTAANAVISRNRGRKDKRLWSDKGLGAPIVGYVADNEHDEAAFVAGEIDKLSDAGLATYGDTAVFYRTNAMSRVFEEVFIRVGMPYKVVGGVRFYERREVRDAGGVPAPARQPGGRRVASAHHQRAEAGIGERAQACVQALAERDRITFWQALRRVEDAPGLAARSPTALLGFVS